MGDRTNIEWTDATWNPVRGCARVSQGCRHCYAERVAARFSREGQPYAGLIHPRTKGWNGSVMLVPEALSIPWRWTRPRRIFVNSMSDLFHEEVPFDFIAAVFWIMSVTTRHTYQVLTKRPERMLEFFRWLMDHDDEPGLNSALWPFDHDHARCLMSNAVSDIGNEYPALNDLAWEPATASRGGYDNCGPGWPYANVWLGVSVEDQATAEERIPRLLQAPAAVRWISAEPLLGPLDLRALGLPDAVRREHWDGPTLDWVVVGGESGEGARPMHPDWPRSLNLQCQQACVPFLFKQWGEWAPGTVVPGGNLGGDMRRGKAAFVRVDGSEGDGHFRQGDVIMRRIGKKAAGRTLDGVLHDAYPEAA